jgi:hypothetical protein
MVTAAIVLSAWFSGMLVAYCLMAINPRMDD